MSLLSPLSSHSPPSRRASGLVAVEVLGHGEDHRLERRGGRVEEGRSGQQSTRDDTDALSLVLLLSASVLCVPDELLGLLLWSSKGA